MIPAGSVFSVSAPPGRAERNVNGAASSLCRADTQGRWLRQDSGIGIESHEAPAKCPSLAEFLIHNRFKKQVAGKADV